MSRMLCAAMILIALAAAGGIASSGARADDAGTAPAAALPPAPTAVASAPASSAQEQPDAGTGTLTTAASGDPARPLGLRDLQEMARTADPRARIAYAQFEQAQGTRDEANWVWFPKFETTVAGGGPTPETRLNGGDYDPDLRDVTEGTKKGLLGGEWGAAINVSVNAQLPLYTFGKIEAGKRAAGHGVEARAALLDGQRNQASFDVARAYWGYQTTRDAEKSIDEMRDRIAQARKQAQEMLDDKSDQITATDAARLDYIADEVEAQSAQALANQRIAEVALKLLVGRLPEEPLQVARETVPPPPEMPQLESLLAQARALRPDLKAAAENVAAHEALLELEKAKYYPELALVGGFNYVDTSNATNPQNAPFAYDPYHVLTAYVALALRGTFDIPQKMARVKQVEAQLHEAQATQVGAERLVRLEIEQALADLLSARGRAEHYIAGSAKAKKLLIKGALALDSGLGQAFDVLLDTLLYSRSEGERLKALLDAQVAWAALERAVGAPVVQTHASAVLTAPAPAAAPGANSGGAVVTPAPARVQQR